MKLTDFNAVVDTYKDNFLIRKKRFFNDKKQIENEKRKKREDNIEAVKAVEPLIKTSTGKSFKPKNFLGGIQRFLGFALAGLILSNLDSIISVAAKIFRKIKEIKEGIKNFVTNIQDTIKSFSDGFNSFKQKLDDLLSPITNADLSALEPFKNQLESVLIATLGVVDNRFKKTPDKSPDKPLGKPPSSPPVSQSTRSGRFRMPGQSAAGGTFRENLSRQQLTRQRMLSPSGPRGPLSRLNMMRRGLGASLESGTAFRGVGSGVQRGAVRTFRQAKNLGRTIRGIGGRGLGGRIPIIGPLLLGYDAYMEDLNGDGIPDKNLDKGLFVAGGSAIGGFLGSFIPIPILGTLLGTMIGGYVGDLFYILLKGGGSDALGQKLKSDIKNVINAGKLIKDWILKGITNIQNQDGGILGNIEVGIPLIGKFKLGGWAEILNPIGNPLKKINILKDSFFSESNVSTPLISRIPALPPTNTLPGGVQSYGASRAGGTRKHAGQDFDPADDKNSKFYSRIGGEVIFAGNVGGGYGNVVDIYNKELGHTERIAEGNRIHVKVGDTVKPGTLVQSGSEMTGVFHYEIRKGKAGKSGSFEGTVDPLKFLNNLKPPEEVSIKTTTSNLISSAGLDQPTTYSEGGVAVRREVNNIIIPISA